MTTKSRRVSKLKRASVTIGGASTTTSGLIPNPERFVPLNFATARTTTTKKISRPSSVRVKPCVFPVGSCFLKTKRPLQLVPSTWSLATLRTTGAPQQGTTVNSASTSWSLPFDLAALICGSAWTTCRVLRLTRRPSHRASAWPLTALAPPSTASP